MSSHDNRDGGFAVTCGPVLQAIVEGRRHAQSVFRMRVPGASCQPVYPMSKAIASSTGFTPPGTSGASAGARLLRRLQPLPPSSRQPPNFSTPESVPPPTRTRTRSLPVSPRRCSDLAMYHKTCSDTQRNARLAFEAYRKHQSRHARGLCAEGALKASRPTLGKQGTLPWLPPIRHPSGGWYEHTPCRSRSEGLLPRAPDDASKTLRPVQWLYPHMPRRRGPRMSSHRLAHWTPSHVTQMLPALSALRMPAGQS
ncbi:hypothetical protein SAMN05192539_104858 [Paraburkholderia diazotrophica]|uniref:Uncharacterized protein n=1 Tax=Paraburkholderia diazotrophica TaxID=667676 RepID=A0A1H7E9T6_9BURK|nr:hypothetical protein SAMN05192539_104858 [Paraburkholderia diazotrophica]